MKLITYHGSSKPLECFAELVLGPDDPLVGTFSFCGRSTSIASSLEVFELVGAVELAASTSISSAILFMSRVNNLAPKVKLGPISRGFGCCHGDQGSYPIRRSTMLTLLYFSLLEALSAFL